MARSFETLHVPRSGIDLGVVVHTAGTPGPTVVVTGNLHGDECTGPAAVHALDALLPGILLRGCVALYPSLNPSGLMARARDVPEDGLDLNRAFPGSRTGSHAERIAATAWTDLTARQPALVIDLHADSAAAIPYAILDRPIHLEPERQVQMRSTLEQIGDATGLTLLWEYEPTLYRRYALDRSLAGAVVNRLGVPAITLEVGPRRVVLPAATRTMLGAIERVLHHLGMIGASPGVVRTRAEGRMRRAAGPRAPTTGLLVPRTTPGTRFERGEVLAHVTELSLRKQTPLVATCDGLLVSWMEGAWVEEGAVPGTIGVAENR
jgi:uncharacterized protein